MRRLAHMVTAFLAAFVFSTAARALDVQAVRAPRGEQVWFVSDHTLPMIAMSVSLPAGSAYDPSGKPGLANFAASLLDEGAGPLNATAFQLALSNRAIRLTITPGRDYLTIQLVTLTDNAKDAFQLLGLALSKPRFDADAITRVRAQILSGIAEDEEDPPTVATKGVYRAYFHSQPYGHAVSGDAAAIQAITAADLKTFAAEHWVRGDLRIAVSGDVDAQTLTTLLNSAFGNLSPRAPAPPPWPAAMGQPGIQVLPMPVPQPSVAFALPGLLRKDHDYLAAVVANYILGGGGSASRLTSDVREKRGLTYDIDTSLEAYRRAGIMVGNFATKSESVKQAIDIVRATMKNFAENGPTEAELADAKTYLTGSFPLSFSSNVDIANALNDFQQEGLSVDYVRKRNALIDAVNLADVKRVARRIYGPRAMTIVVAGGLGGSPASHTAVPTAAPGH